MMSRTVAVAKPSSAKTWRAAARMVSRFCALVNSRRLAEALASIAGKLTRWPLLRARPHSRRHIRVTIACKTGQQLLLDARDQTRPLVNQRGVELHQAGAGSDLGIGVGPAADATHTHQGHGFSQALAHAAQHFGGRRKQRPARKTACFLCMRRFELR